MPDRAPLSLSKQAELIEALIDRCIMRDGSIAAESFLRIETGDVEDLQALANRLRRMGPYESAIRKMVTQK